MIPAPREVDALMRQVGKGKLTDRQFNDEVLKSGPIPIEFIRAAMLNVPLKRDTKSSWKFAGEKPGAEKN